MSFQIRHVNFGLYQGDCMGLGFWYPMSETPEQGICKFPSQKDVEDHIAFLCSDASDPMKLCQLSIETFNENLHATLLLVGKNKNPEYFNCMKN